MAEERSIESLVQGRKKCWDRLPKESAKDYELFRLYLEQEERSFPHLVANELSGKKITVEQLMDLAERWLWDERCQAYDADKVLKQSQKRLERREKFQENTEELALELSEKMVRVMKTGDLTQLNTVDLGVIKIAMQDKGLMQLAALYKAVIGEKKEVTAKMEFGDIGWRDGPAS